MRIKKNEAKRFGWKKKMLNIDIKKHQHWNAL